MILGTQAEEKGPLFRIVRPFVTGLNVSIGFFIVTCWGILGGHVYLQGYAGVPLQVDNLTPCQ